MKLNPAETVSDQPKLNDILLFPVMPTDPLPYQIIDYNFSSLKLSNPGGKMPATVKNCKLSTGPGETIMGHLPHSFELGQNGYVTADISKSIISNKLFAVRICFLAPHHVKQRQELVTSTKVPFTLHLDKTNGTDEFKLVANVHTANYDWAGADTTHSLRLKSGKWYVADLVYSVDTLSLFVDGKLTGVNAFPKGDFKAPTGGLIIAGAGENKTSYKFTGKIAALQFHYKVPHVLLPLADVSRNTPEWFIANKAMAVGKNVLGDRVGKQAYWSLLSIYTQNYEHGQIQYSPVFGVAYEMHADIWHYYDRLPDTEKKALGCLASDGIATPGGSGYKNLFRQGGIYFSLKNISICHVTGQIYLDYRKLGEIDSLGYPTTIGLPINGGLRQKFQGNDIFLKDGAASGFAVCGPMLTCYDTASGPDIMGFPISNYTQVIINGNSTNWFTSKFENGVIYWNTNKGAFNLTGEIATTYNTWGNTSGLLGFPTSAEIKVAGDPGIIYNTFENGTIVTLPSKTYACTPFQIRFESITTNSEDPVSANDLTIDTYIKGLPLKDYPAGDYHQRFPDGDDDYSNTNDVTLTATLGQVIIPNDPSLSIKFEADVWDIDDWVDNDPVGTYISPPLDITNAWGLAVNEGLFEGQTEDITSLTWSVRRKVDISTLTPGQLWWGVKNSHINELSYHQFSMAFTGVNYPFKFYDPRDWFDGIYYELAIKGIAKHGYCCGMCIEAVLAWQNNGMFSLPLDQYTSTINAVAATEFALIHCRQASGAAVWWKVGQFLSGNTHSPKDVYNETMALHAMGQQPLIGVSQNYFFNGKPHILLPYNWRKDGNIWYIDVYDPNVKTTQDNNLSLSQHIEINVNEGVNSFTYNANDGDSYSGDAWSGGRFYYIPWSTVSERSGTPGDDILSLFHAGCIIFGGADGSTESITDTNGNDLDFAGTDATLLLKNGKPVDHCFFPFRPADESADPNTAPIYIRRGLISDNAANGKDYIHKIRAKTNAPFNYVIKNILTEVQLQSNAVADEVLTVFVKNTQTMHHALAIAVEKDRVVSVDVVNKLPDGSGCIRLHFNIPVQAKKHLELNLRPGLSGLDIMAGKNTIKTVITATTIDGGRVPEVTKYAVEIKGGLRIRHSTMATAGELLLSQIDTLLGPARDFYTLKGVKMDV